MQSLWSRAGQAHSCGCRACRQTFTGLGRRATTAAQRRKPTFADIFTACYSSVLATAAVVDAIRKEDRRSELGRQLEEARSELAQVTAPRMTRWQQNKSDLDTDQLDILWKTMKEVLGTQILDYDGSTPRRPYLSPETRKARDLYARTPSHRFGRGAPTRDSVYIELERTLLKEEHQGLYESRHATSLKHLSYEQRSIMGLTMSLLRRAHMAFVNSQTRMVDAGRDPEKPKAFHTFEQAVQLLAQGYPRYSLRSVNPEAAQKEMLALNEQLRAIVAEKGVPIKERVGRICYNLLVVPFAPDITSFNTLMVALDKAGLSRFSEAVVNSFYYQSMSKPTPTTFAAILNHYTQSRERSEFLRSVACITGWDEVSGGKFKRYAIEHVYENPLLAVRTANEKQWTWGPTYVWMHVPINTTATETLIRGFTQFRMLGAAVACFWASVRAGVRVNFETVRHMLDTCKWNLDMAGAVRFIQDLVNYGETWPEMMEVLDNSSYSYVVWHLHLFLDMLNLLATYREVPVETLRFVRISRFQLKQLLSALERASAIASDRVPDLAEEFRRLRTRLGTRNSRSIQLQVLDGEILRVATAVYSLRNRLLEAARDMPIYGIPVTMAMAEEGIDITLKLNRQAVDILSSCKMHGAATRVAIKHCEEFDASSKMSLGHSADEVPTVLPLEVEEKTEYRGDNESSWQPSTWTSIFRSWKLWLFS
ncbi:hypothetical protein S7711_05075 [Stachybotrys chartarum IBT 7711]|uniref:Uncharacterized protein n=1 Tax=Stachybotrys chartarum (strain CBS 109288 / IBT 7711) TaxID=1280523 RepID=A0A084ANS6_STACB|nr:hypothetical protein S7711_05075 [Stachybotrys chartarum IBT 7711]KFA47422.1 hypothetical protein S40293_05352 [Stachybotrys chartarum IBT 40293]